MDTALQALLSWQFILFCLAVTSFTYVVRVIVDYILNAKGIVPKDCHLWSELILPILPVFVGSIGSLVSKQYHFPLDISSASGRLAFGLCAGLLSGFIWRIVKATLSSKLGLFQNNTVNPVIAPDVGEGASAEKSNDKV